MNVQQSHTSGPMTMDSIRLERELKTKWELGQRRPMKSSGAVELRVLHGKRASNESNRNKHTQNLENLGYEDDMG